ncbi:hypothetical protein NX801_16330 [Streptomyces sp. LP05-1]|uniref:Transposase (putative) YhgA-like domain-containing protein n=1 Tax=Streptomyces pyxinae TaxID=2970734 RepID=A0ABT2CKH9_9ACTN|nr:hypothetical protein [Streptomyces sp. LP05-1]MCS0637201.1 hypothetical protein [Streptomyces sp. LP05-1]
MVGSPHEAMHRIFQEFPKLVDGVCGALQLPAPRTASATPLPTDLTELRPLERRIDTLMRCESETGGSFLLAVEAQGKKDPRKPTGWANYVTHLYEKYELPLIFLVVCQDRATAEWAAHCPTPVGLLQPDLLTLRPLVVGPHNLPVITDPEEALADPVLASLAAIAHAKDQGFGAILKALSTALRDTPEDIANPLIELTSQGLGTRPAGQHWRDLVTVDLSFYTSPLAEGIRDEGRDEGHEKGLAEGREQGVALSVLNVLKARGIDVPEALRERVIACRDHDTLQQWLARAANATTAEEIFAGEE